MTTLDPIVSVPAVGDRAEPREFGPLTRVTVELTCTRQTGGVAIAASAEFVCSDPQNPPTS
jgi:hypothetical protein